ncbi:MAG: SGNH/GDSL hydrolase family protein [Deltaproteobacteria bacterium]|nr:SGNH/GDSL hydrolase family protein [Deltaproteobacteria bacterium]
MKPILANLCLLFVTLLVMLIGAEVLFRVIPRGTAPSDDRPKFYYAPEGARDLRNGPYDTAKPASTYRIAVVGDSFSFAPYMQFDDTFAKRLERMLNLNLAAPRVEVLNYGMPRLSTNHEVPLVEQALREGADLVLLQITLNDAERKPVAPGAGLLRGRVGIGGELEFDSGLLSHWKFGAFVLQRIHAWSSRHAYQKYFFDLFEHKQGWALFRDSLAKIRAKCRKADVPVVGIIFPLFEPTLVDYPFLPIHEKIATALSELDYRVYDLLPSFRGMPTDRLQVLPGVDRHPNEIAHRVAAESLYEYLAQEALLPAESVIKVRVRNRISADLSTANEDVAYTPAATK